MERQPHLPWLPICCVGRDSLYGLPRRNRQNYHNNLLIGEPYNGLHYVVVEADEYDRSF